MKRLISLATAVIMCFSATVISFAEEAKEVHNFDIENAISYALENSTKMIKAEADAEAAKNALSEARVAYRDYKASEFSTFPLEEAYLSSGLLFDSATASYEQAKRNVISESNAVKISVKKSFYTCVNNERKIKTASENLENTKQKTVYANEQYNQGIISKLTLKSFELAEMNALNQYNTAVRNYNLSVIEFKNLLNIPLSEEVVFKGTFEEKELAFESPEAAVEMIKNSNAYLTIKEGRALADKKMKIAKGWYSSNEPGYFKELGTYNSTLSGLIDAENQLNFGVISLYSSIVGIGDNVEYLKEYVQMMKENTEASYLQYELGMITSNNYIEIQQKYFEAQNNLLDAQLGYYIAVLEYVNMYSGNADM